MCLECKPLLKAIDAYLARAENDLAGELGEEGYAEPKKTLQYAQDIEDDVAAALLAETDYFLAQAEKAVDLEAFAAEIWPGVKLNDDLKAKLTTIFTERLAEFMPEFIGYYIAQTDRDLKLRQVSQRTTAWVEDWSQDLADIMQLNSHTEIEAILKKGLDEGSSIAEFTRAIQQSGIRDEYYKARRVAVTEVLGAHSVAQQEAFMQSPAVANKGWRHTGSYRNEPRQNHVDMDGQVVPKDQPFELHGIKGGTYYPMYPRDTILPPEERINCHCIAQPVVDKETLGLDLEERKRLQQETIDRMDSDWERELDARNKAKAGIKIDPFSTKVTGQYTRTATPGKGEITYGAGYVAKKHSAEISTAKFLHDTFGGDIELLPEASEFGVKTPDYRWRGKMWELKTISSVKAADAAMRSALKQIQADPGGVILDCGTYEIAVEELREAVISRFKRTGLNSLDVMVLTQGQTAADVFRYKK